jgi:hypothetical protein
MGCPGKRGGIRCGAPLWRCRKCLNVGCMARGCTNQGFSGGRCLRCGSANKEHLRR